MSDSILVPGPPFVPVQPPTEIQRQITEWQDRADLARHAFDGQWRVLCSFDEFGMDLMARYLPPDLATERGEVVECCLVKRAGVGSERHWVKEP